MRNQQESKRTPKPLSLRLNFEQRAALEQESDGLPISTYIKRRLFGSMKGLKDTRIHRPVKDKQELARLLGMLGQSSVFANLQTLADAAKSGSLILDPDTKAALLRAVQDVEEMRSLLVRSLGLRG